jgi:ADP-heptose:LPS heptosyltransferase
MRLLRRDAAADDQRTLWLRPEWGFGDHLMLAAVVAGIKAERPDLRIRIAADHPEIFRRNPHVEDVASVSRLRRTDPDRLARYREVTRRPPSARHLQTSGHLLDDMYASVGIPLRERPHRPRLYLTRLESWSARGVDALPRPRIVVAPHGPPDVRLPNKIYPWTQWLDLAPRLAVLPGSLLQVGSSREGPLLPGARDFRDRGFRRTAAVLARCDLLLTHVGGIMHLAAAVGLPAVVLYGAAEHPVISGYPWNYNIYTPITCGPCWLETACSHHSCMRFLVPARVMHVVEAVLAGRPTGTIELVGASPPADA